MITSVLSYHLTEKYMDIIANVRNFALVKK